MRSILDHESKILFDTDTEPLLTPGLWILPLYRELLNSASRNRSSPASERARDSTSLVKIICKENKEQRGKRKYHDGTPYPKDRGGFTQWFGSCNLLNTLYVWFPTSWAPIVAEQLFEKSSNSENLYSNIQQGQPARGLSQNPSRQEMVIAGYSCNACVEYKQQSDLARAGWQSSPGQLWCLAGRYPVRCLSQKCSAAWQGAPGQRLTVSIMLPGRQLADEWLDFMCFHKGTCGPPSPPRGSHRDDHGANFSQRRPRLQTKHLWMDIKTLNGMYTEAPTGMSRKQLHALLFNRAAKGNQRNPYEEKAHSGPDYNVVRRKWKQSQWWMWYYKDQRAPEVLDINGSIRAFKGKDENAHAVLTYMDYCAKRWQTREGTYQLKRRRLLPDVRDPPEQGDEEVDMTDIWSTTWRAWITYYKVEEMIWEAMGGAQVSPLLRGFSPALFVCLVVYFGLFFGFVFGCFAQPVKRLLQVIPVSPFCIRISRELTDHAPCSLGNAGKKSLCRFNATLAICSLSFGPANQARIWLRLFWASIVSHIYTSLQDNFTSSSLLSTDPL